MKYLYFYSFLLFFVLPKGVIAQETKKSTGSIFLAPYSKQHSGRYGCVQYHLSRKNFTLYVGTGIHYNKVRYTRDWKNSYYVDNGYAGRFYQYFMPQIGFEYAFNYFKGNTVFFTFCELYASKLGNKYEGFDYSSGSDTILSFSRIVNTYPYFFVSFNIGFGAKIKVTERIQLKSRFGISSTILGKAYKTPYEFYLDGLDTWAFSAGILYNLKKHKTK